MRQMQDSFLSMAQWTLGSAIAVALALAAFAWHTNKSNYERDRETVRSEAAATRDTLEALLKAKLTESQAALDASLTSRQDEIRTSVEKACNQSLPFASDIVQFETMSTSCKRKRWRKRRTMVLPKACSLAVYRYGQVLDLYVKRHTDDYEPRTS